MLVFLSPTCVVSHRATCGGLAVVCTRWVPFDGLLMLDRALWGLRAYVVSLRVWYACHRMVVVCMTCPVTVVVDECGYAVPLLLPCVCWC